VEQEKILISRHNLITRRTIMTKEYKSIIGDIGAYSKELHKLIPDTMAGFTSMAKSATATKILDEKTKELIALVLGVAAHCDGCLGYHTKALARLEATREEVAEALGMAIYMGGGPSLMYAADALRSFDQFKEV
jgi:AhpD family alkylhydroperoxidase